MDVTQFLYYLHQKHYYVRLIFYPFVQSDRVSSFNYVQGPVNDGKLLLHFKEEINNSLLIVQSNVTTIVTCTIDVCRMMIQNEVLASFWNRDQKQLSEMVSLALL